MSRLDGAACVRTADEHSKNAGAKGEEEQRTLLNLSARSWLHRSNSASDCPRFCLKSSHLPLILNCTLPCLTVFDSPLMVIEGSPPGSIADVATRVGDFDAFLA